MTRKKFTARKKISKDVKAKKTSDKELGHLFRPDRLIYIKGKKPKIGSCVFCEIREAGVSIDSLCLFQTQDVMVLLNRYPYNPGHLLVLPTKHLRSVFELPEVSYLSVMKALNQAAAILQQCYSPQSLNVGMNLGAQAGAGIPDHSHWHIIPRWEGDTNFFPLIAKAKVIPETLEQSYRNLIPYFESLKNSESES